MPKFNLTIPVKVIKLNSYLYMIEFGDLRTEIFVVPGEEWRITSETK